MKQTDDYHRNMHACTGDETPCARCGRAITDLDGATWVEMNTDWNVLPAGAPESNGPTSQGCFPLGPTCARLVAEGRA